MASALPPPFLPDIGIPARFSPEAQSNAGDAVWRVSWATAQRAINLLRLEYLGFDREFIKSLDFFQDELYVDEERVPLISKRADPYTEVVKLKGRKAGETFRNALIWELGRPFTYSPYQ